jgi:hypothetical protein
VKTSSKVGAAGRAGPLSRQRPVGKRDCAVRRRRHSQNQPKTRPRWRRERRETNAEPGEAGGGALAEEVVESLRKDGGEGMGGHL